MNFNIRTRNDDNGRGDPCVRGPAEVATGVGEETPEDKNCCCGWVRVETEGHLFFIEERDGGGGRLWRV